MILDVSNKLVLNPLTQSWCKIPYPGHPKGCPNYGKDGCPPTDMLDNLIDINGTCYLVLQPFNLYEHIKSMKHKHPEWTERQCRCVLYWQARVRRLLRNKVTRFLKEHPQFDYVDCVPEARGLDVFSTVRKTGKLKLERNPYIVYKIALVGKRKEDE